MESKKQLQNMLYEKMLNEQENFVERLKYSTPAEIIEQAYELIMREDILMTFEGEYLSDKQIKELLKFEYPLSACYESWLKSDCSHMEMLRDTIDDFTKGLVQKSEQAKQNDKKRYEPER